jgi:uncharacterized protein
MAELENRLRVALKAAMKSRDPIAKAAIRSALGAIDNARSVDVAGSPTGGGSVHVAGGIEGLGAGDAPRRELDDQQLTEIVAMEMESRVRAAEEYQSLGRNEEASQLRSESRVLERILAEPISDG